MVSPWILNRGNNIGQASQMEHPVYPGKERPNRRGVGDVHAVDLNILPACQMSQIFFAAG